MDATRSPRPAPTKPQWPSKNAAELGHQLVQDIGRPAGALRVPAIQPLGWPASALPYCRGQGSRISSNCGSYDARSTHDLRVASGHQPQGGFRRRVARRGPITVVVDHLQRQALDLGDVEQSQAGRLRIALPGPAAELPPVRSNCAHSTASSPRRTWASSAAASSKPIHTLARTDARLPASYRTRTLAPRSTSPVAPLRDKLLLGVPGGRQSCLAKASFPTAPRGKAPRAEAGLARPSSIAPSHSAPSSSVCARGCRAPARAGGQLVQG
jgi:hypothetical protein